jgi:NADPH-dependent ferric siderophore reductase
MKEHSVTALHQQRPWEYSAFPVHVAATTRITPHMVRITLAGRELRHFAPWSLDQRIKLILPMADGSTPQFGLLEDPTPHPRDWYSRWKALPEDRRNVLRTYTPAAIRPEEAEIDVDFYIHEPAGPASSWALTCGPGDDLIITGPDIRAGYTGYGIHYLPPEPPDLMLLVGDESSLPAIRNILSTQHDTGAVHLLLELGDPRDDTTTTSGARSTIITRGTAPGEHLETAVREWTAQHRSAIDRSRAPYAWIAGEAASTSRIRRHLTGDAGLAKDRVVFQGYWKLGAPLVG